MQKYEEGSRLSAWQQLTQLTPSLYVSGVAAMSADKLKSHGIDLIVNASNLSYSEVFGRSDDALSQISSAVCTNPEEDCESSNDFLMLCVPVQDHVQADLLPYFQAVADLIRANEERGGKTLVHCLAGVSRSVSLCIAYLITHYQPSPQDFERVPAASQQDCKAVGGGGGSSENRFTVYQALSFIHSKRVIANPNSGFKQQLLAFESRIRTGQSGGEQLQGTSHHFSDEVSKLNKGGQDALFHIEETTKKLRDNIINKQ